MKYSKVDLVSEKVEYKLGNVEDLWLEYDRQNDVLYLNFTANVEDADEEVLVGEDVVLRIKDGRVISIMIMKFLEKLGLTVC